VGVCADPSQLWTLADEMGSPFDLLDIRGVSTVMQYQVLRGGRRI